MCKPTWALGGTDAKEWPGEGQQRQRSNRGLSFFQRLGLKRQSKVAKDVEFSRIVAEVTDEGAKRPRNPPPWAGQRRSPSPIAEVEQESIKALSYTPAPCLPEEAVNQLPPMERNTLLDELSLEVVKRLWFAIKDNALASSASGASGKIDASTGLIATTTAPETIGLTDFLKLGCQYCGQSESMRRLLAAIFHRVAHHGASKSSVRTHSVATALVLICREEPRAKLRCLFAIFDADDDGCVGLDDIFDLFVSVRMNDLTRTSAKIAADITFGGELSLQEAKRLFELTVPHLSVDTDIVVFDDFFKAVQTCTVVLPSLLPGLFSLDWFFEQEASFSLSTVFPDSPTSPTKRSDTSPRAAESSGQRSAVAGRAGISIGQQDRGTKLSEHTREVRKNFIATLRRGQEHLDLSSRRGRATRIMHHQLSKERPTGTSENAKLEEPKAHARLGMGLNDHCNNGPTKAFASRHARPASSARVQPRSVSVHSHRVETRSTVCNASERKNEAVAKASRAAEADVSLGLDDMGDDYVSPKPPQRAKISYDMRKAAALAELPQSSRFFRLGGDSPNASDIRSLTRRLRKRTGVAARLCPRT